MSFDTLLGNEQLKKDLSASLSRGNISHCYLISGPEGSGKRTLAKLLAAAILCRGSDKPCLTCQPCRKVLDGNHPDFITVDDEEHKTVTVRVVREARADIYVMPNEAEHKIYLFPRAQDMGIEGQNALLKVLEEPPGYVVFILLADNPEKLLPTVRSRCRELKMGSLPADLLTQQLAREFPEKDPRTLQAAAVRSGGFLGQAKKLLEEDTQASAQTEQLVKGLLGEDPLALPQVLVPMEKWKRDALTEQLENWLQLLEEALAGRSGAEAVSEQARRLARNCSAAQLYRRLQTLKKALLYTQSNVSTGAVCGWLLWELSKQ